MFLFIPIIAVVLLISAAARFAGVPQQPYDDSSLAFIYVFLVGPFAVSFLSYSTQYLISKNNGPWQRALFRFASFPAYLIFFALIMPQIIGDSGSWLYLALGDITGHFKWVLAYREPGVNFTNLALVILVKVLVLSQYYFIFSFYMVISEIFKSLSSKKYYTYLPVGFLSNNRILFFGCLFIFIIVSLESILGYSDTFVVSMVASLGTEHSALIMQLISVVSRFAFPFLFLLVFPLLLPLIAGWKPLPEGRTLDLIKEVSKKHHFTYHNVYLAGQPGLLTAGIIGVFPWTRNLMFTSDIIDLLDEKEQESVLLHEIGHAKYYHILVYLLSFMAFSAIIELLSNSLFGLGFFNESIVLTASAVSFLAFIYFGWGWLSRQCERQADLHAAESQGTPQYIVSSFHKLSETLGGVLDKPSWHHGSLGVRIKNLEEAYEDNGASRLRFHQQLKKIKLSIVVIFLCAAVLYPFLSTPAFRNQDRQVNLKNSLAMNQFMLGDYAGSIEVYESLLVYLKEKDIGRKASKQVSTIAHYNMACAYAQMEDVDNAFAQLEKVLPLLVPQTMKRDLSVHKFRSDPDFDFIRKSERFETFLNKVKRIKKAFDDNEANPFIKIENLKK